MFFNGLKRRKVTDLLVAPVGIPDSLSISSFPSFYPLLCVSLNHSLRPASRYRTQWWRLLQYTWRTLCLGEGLRGFPIHGAGYAVGGYVGSSIQFSLPRKWMPLKATPLPLVPSHSSAFSSRGLSCPSSGTR